MIRIEYETESMNGAPVRHVMFVKSLEEADEICDAVDRYGYKLVDVSRYVDEPDEEDV